MKNKKLNLDELKVKSFVTSFKKTDSNTVKGGVTLNLCEETAAGTQCIETARTCPDGQADWTADYSGCWGDHDSNLCECISNVADCYSIQC